MAALVGRIQEGYLSCAEREEKQTTGQDASIRPHLRKPTHMTTQNKINFFGGYIVDSP